MNYRGTRFWHTAIYIYIHLIYIYIYIHIYSTVDTKGFGAVTGWSRCHCLVLGMVPPKLANDLGRHLDIDIIEIDVQPPKKWWKRIFLQSITCYHMLSLAFLQGFYQLQHFSDFYKGPFPGNHGFFFSACRSWFCWKSWQRGAQLGTDTQKE